MRRADVDQRGLSESVQYAVIFPLLMLATLGIIEAGLWMHAHNVALRAAQAAANEASGSYGDAASARGLAADLAAAGGLKSVTVSISRGAGRVDVTVSAHAPLILDLGLGSISERAVAPMERVTTP